MPAVRLKSLTSYQTSNPQRQVLQECSNVFPSATQLETRRFLTPGDVFNYMPACALISDKAGLESGTCIILYHYVMLWAAYEQGSRT